MNCYIKTEINSDNITKIKVIETIEKIVAKKLGLTEGTIGFKRFWSYYSYWRL